MEEKQLVADQELVKKAEEVMETQEFGKRRLTGVPFILAYTIAFAMSCFQLYAAFFGTLTATLQRSVHLSFAITLCFLFYPLSKKSKRGNIPFYDYLLAAIGGMAAIYVAVFYEDLVKRIGAPTHPDLLMGCLTVILILEATRRAVGLPLVVISGLFCRCPGEAGHLYRHHGADRGRLGCCPSEEENED